MPAETTAELRFSLDVDRALRLLWIAIAVVACLGYLREIIAIVTHVPTAKLGLNEFRLNGELSLPAWFSSLLLAAVGIAMLAAGGIERRAKIRTAGQWQGLGLIFVYLSLDEMISIHEKLNATFHNIPNVLGLLRFHWVIGGAMAALAVALLFIPFLLRLPRATAIRLIVAGAVYVFGALVMEMIDGEFYGRPVPYAVLTSIEETLEMIGAGMALRCVLLHLATQLPPCAASLVSRRHPAAIAAA